MDRNLLFLCSRNKLRSPTAEAIFRGRPGIETDSAGLSPDAEVALSPEQIEWADLILVMEKVHRSRLNRKFGKHLAGKRVVVLEIPDRYDFMDPELVRLLEARCAPYL
jgi:predicted protein tyrosine phosphatase